MPKSDHKRFGSSRRINLNLHFVKNQSSQSYSSGCRGEMMLMLVSLLCCLPLVKACLQCDPKIQKLHEELIQSSTTDKELLKHDFRWFTEQCRKQKGFIDPTTFYRAKTEYKSEFQRFLSLMIKGTIKYNIRPLVMKGIDILTKHLAILNSEGYCPNKCGILRRVLMKCSSCQQEIRTCYSPTRDTYCGVFQVHAMDGETKVLNCFRPWHLLIAENTYYHYHVAFIVPGTRKVQKMDLLSLLKTSDSFFVLNNLKSYYQGTYRCSLQSKSDAVLYTVDFEVTVSDLPPKTPQPMITLPPLPPEEAPPDLHIYKILFLTILAVITGLSLVASLGFTVVLRLIMKRRRAERELRRRREEEN